MSPTARTAPAFRTPHKATRRAPLALALALAAMAALTTLVACSSTTPAGTSTLPTAASAPPSVGTESPEPPATPVGLEWTERALPPTSSPDADYLEFVAAGALWLYAPDLPTTLWGTADGDTWQTLDLTAHGLPAAATMRAGTGGCASGPAIADAADHATLVYYTSAPEGHPDGLLNQIWLVDISGIDAPSGAAVTVTTGASVGLENMPPAADGDTFRTMCVTTFVDLGGQRVMIGEGQWWHPYATGNTNAFTAFESTQGTWEVYSTKASAFLGAATTRIAGAGVVGGKLVVILNPTYEATGFTAWTSPDGRAWEQAAISFADADADADISVDGVLAAPDQLLVLTSAAQGAAAEVTVWASADGTTWTPTLLGGGDYLHAGIVATVPEGYLVSADYTTADTWDIYAWTSADAVTWVPLGEDGNRPPELLDARSLRSGLVALGYQGIQFSGEPWS